MQLSFEENAHALLAELFVRRNTVFSIFVVISLTLLAVGSVWPKKYLSSVIVHVNAENILTPLMQGTAERTHSTNHVSNAQEIIFGDKIMDRVIEKAGWLKTNPSVVEIEKIRKDVIEHIKITGYGANLIRIEYNDHKPMRAYITAKTMADLFIKEGESSKIEESTAAYDFIEKQVNEYLEKLTSVEEQLKEYRSDNPDSRPGAEAEVSTRVNNLQAEIETTKLELREEEIKLASLEKQLSGEAAITISHSKEGQYRGKIVSLQSELETLRLDYKDTYPEIVRIKHQIEDIKISLLKEIETREKAKTSAKSSGKVYVDESMFLNPLYQQLRSRSSSSETQIETLRARKNEMEKMLTSEYQRMRRIHDSEASLSKLTRNYEVNQAIYQDLLRRRENARVSKSLDEEQQGLTFVIQEPAKIPLLPTGIRFFHFAIAGIILGILIPVVLIYLLLNFEPKVRFSKIISKDMGIPVLAEINHISTSLERSKIKINLIFLISGMIMVFIVYGYVGWMKYTGQI